MVRLDEGAGDGPIGRRGGQSPGGRELVHPPAGMRLARQQARMAKSAMPEEKAMA